MRLANHTALVTGSTRGIGRAIAEMFAAEGAKVAVTGRTRDVGEEVVKGIQNRGGEAIYLRTDVAKEDDVAAAVTDVVSAFGNLTILVNNAAPTDLMRSGTVDGSITDLTTDRWEQIMLGTLTSVFWGCKYAIPEMKKSNKGSIINISSISATRGMAGVDAYTAAKAGMQGLTRSIASGYGRYNIRCNTIVTGMIPHTARRKGPFVPILGGMQLITRLGRATDIAYAATYFASDESEFVTGAELPLDGGLTSAVKLDVTETLRQAAQREPVRQTSPMAGDELPMDQSGV